MPKGDTRATEATLNFIARNATSGEFSKEFRRERFKENFPHYYGREAISTQHEKALEVIMSCDVCLTGFDHVHEHLHAHDVVAKSCKNTSPRDTPFAFFYYLGLAIPLLVVSLVTLQPFGIWELSATSWVWLTGSLLGIAAAAWLLYRSLYVKI